MWRDFRVTARRPMSIVIGLAALLSGGCQRAVRGTDTPPDRIQVTAPVSTKMACSTGMDLEQRYLQMLTSTRSYAVSDSGLALRGESGVQARFVAR